MSSDYHRSPFAMLYRFPAEILDGILLLASTPSPHTSTEQLKHDLEDSSDYRLSLLYSCTVCKKVLARAQPLLWRDLLIHPFPSHAQVHGMISMDPRGPKLASYVRKVEVSGVSTMLLEIGAAANDECRGTLRGWRGDVGVVRPKASRTVVECVPSSSLTCR